MGAPRWNSGGAPFCPKSLKWRLFRSNRPYLRPLVTPVFPERLGKLVSIGFLSPPEIPKGAHVMFPGPPNLGNKG